MRKLLLSAAVLAASFVQAQTSLYSNNFEGAPGFNLNTTTQGGSTSGDNPWIINNVYAGGSGTFFCPALGFNFPFTVPTAPSQPAGISPSNSYYMHVTPQIAIDAGGTLPAASYIAADGFCIFGGASTFTEMTGDISTVGYSTVELDMWWACGGSTANYGQLFYSTNGGANWTAVNCPVTATNQWRAQTTWTNTVLSNPAWANQGTLRFGFQFVTGSSATGSELDPGFAIDDIEIFGSNPSANTVTTGGALTPTNWCFNTAQNINVDFTSTGTFTAGNTYTAQLSDASGSFAAPTAIGTLSSTANSGTISATVPAGTAVGSGYRIRVVSSTPATTGSDNGVNFTIHALPNVNLGSFTAVCQNDAPFTLTGGSPAGGTYSGTGVTANVFNPSSAGAGAHTITYSYTDGNSCSASAQQPITVNACASIDELDNVFSLYPNPANEYFMISAELAIERVELVDLNGKLLKTYTVSDNYELENVTSGTYLVIIYTETGNYNKRLTVK